MAHRSEKASPGRRSLTGSPRRDSRHPVVHQLARLCECGNTDPERQRECYGGKQRRCNWLSKFIYPISLNTCDPIALQSNATLRQSRTGFKKRILPSGHTFLFTVCLSRSGNRYGKIAAGKAGKYTSNCHVSGATGYARYWYDKESAAKQFPVFCIEYRMYS